MVSYNNNHHNNDKTLGLFLEICMFLKKEREILLNGLLSVPLTLGDGLGWPHTQRSSGSQPWKHFWQAHKKQLLQCGHFTVATLVCISKSSVMSNTVNNTANVGLFSTSAQQTWLSELLAKWTEQIFSTGGWFVLVRHEKGRPSVLSGACLRLDISHWQKWIDPH